MTKNQAGPVSSIRSANAQHKQVKARLGQALGLQTLNIHSLAPATLHAIDHRSDSVAVHYKRDPNGACLRR